MSRGRDRRIERDASDVLRFAVARISVHPDAPGLRNTFRRPRRSGYMLHVVLTISGT